MSSLHARILIAIGCTAIGIVLITASRALAEPAPLRGACQSESDVWNSRSGIRSARTRRVAIVENRLELEIAMTTAYCVKTKIGYGVSLVPAYTTNSVPHEDRPAESIRVTPLEIRLRAYRDGMFDLLIDNLITKEVAQSSFLVLSAQIPLEQVLDADERVRLDAGEAVDLRLASYIVAKLHTENTSRGLSNISEKSARAPLIGVRIQLLNGQLSASLR